MNKQDCLNAAIEITKEYTSGGGGSPATVLNSVYQELKKLVEDVKSE